MPKVLPRQEGIMRALEPALNMSRRDQRSQHPFLHALIACAQPIMLIMLIILANKPAIWPTQF